MSAAAAAEAAALVATLYNIRMVNMGSVGAIAWVCYDIFLTFGQETIILESVTGSFYLELTSRIRVKRPMVYGQDFLLDFKILQPYPPYTRQSNIMFFTVNISLLIPVTTQTAISVSTVILRGIQTIPQSAALPIPGCVAHGDPRSNLLVVAWIPKVLADLIFFVLTLVKFIQVVRRLSGTTLSTIFREGNKLAPLLTLFVKDGAVWFVVVLASDIQAAYFIIAKANNPLQDMGVAWLVATVAVAASRLVLRLRGTISGAGSTRLEELELSDVFKPSTALAGATVPFQTVPASGERPATKPVQHSYLMQRFVFNVTPFGIQRVRTPGGSEVLNEFVGLASGVCASAGCLSFLTFGDAEFG
ncbi:hypothetical protein JB92DRAFT_2838767 [Gautieria morchelliformis]|nr:hypothetical protein JB92DRAFT_2838767 [Gautieria morchelliformis]